MGAGGRPGRGHGAGGEAPGPEERETLREHAAPVEQPMASDGLPRGTGPAQGVFRVASRFSLPWRWYSDRTASSTACGRLA